MHTHNTPQDLPRPPDTLAATPLDSLLSSPAEGSGPWSEGALAATPLDSLLDGRRLWRGAEARAALRAAIPTGHPDLNDTLGGGWPQGGLTEVLGLPEGPGSLGLFMPALARLSHGGQWLAWVAPPCIPYAPALVDQGMNVKSLLWVHARPHRDTLWALEQALRSGTCAAVLGWLPRVEPVALRRLQLAAEAGDTWGLIFRPPEAARQPSPASLRLRLEARHEGVEVTVLKQRGAWPARRLFIHHDHLAGRSGAMPGPGEAVEESCPGGCTASGSTRRSQGSDTFNVERSA